MSSPRMRRTLADYPDLVAEWHPRNGSVTPDQVSFGSAYGPWWRCRRRRSHEWRAPAYRRTKGIGCPFCSGKRIGQENSLAAKRPAIAATWHPTKNGKLRPEDVTPRSSKRVWWKCPAAPDHVWRETPDSRRESCPFCANARVSVTNSVATRAPHLVQQWHPRNRLKPQEVVYRSSRPIWWKCPRAPDHEWESQCYTRALNGVGCPFCRGLRASITYNLATRHPELAEQWHPSKNQPLSPQNVVRERGRRFWWKCTFGHEWTASIDSRIAHPSCPGCRIEAREQRKKERALLRRRRRDPNAPARSRSGALRSRGITLFRKKAYHARVSVKGESHHAGAWRTRREAAIARDRAVLYFEIDLPLNYPIESRALGPASPAQLIRQANTQKRKRRRPNQSRFIGVYKDGDYWAASIRLNHRTTYLGNFATERQAAVARDRVALKLGVPRARLNFPTARLAPTTAEQVRRKPVQPRLPKSRAAEGLLGVRHTDRGAGARWHASITINNHERSLGQWDTPEEAALAYDRAHLHYYGRKRVWRLNFQEKANGRGAANPRTLSAEAREVFKERTSSRFRGVFWSTSRRCWMSVIQFAKRQYHLGAYQVEKEAAIAYDKRALDLLGPDARLNFHPDTGEEILGRPFTRAPRPERPGRSKGEKRRP